MLAYLINLNNIMKKFIWDYKIYKKIDINNFK